MWQWGCATRCSVIGYWFRVTGYTGSIFVKSLKIYNFCSECLIRVLFEESESWERVLSFKIGFSTWKRIFFYVMVLKCIIIFMCWCDVILNALWLLVMSYADVVKLYNMCLMHDSQYWRCTLTMVVGHCAWSFCCMHSCCWTNGPLLVNLKSHYMDWSASWFGRWWNQWVIIRDEGNTLVALILGGGDRSSELECSHIGTACIESSWWVSLHCTLVQFVVVLDGWLCCYHVEWLLCCYHVWIVVVMMLFHMDSCDVAIMCG